MKYPVIIFGATLSLGVWAQSVTSPDGRVVGDFSAESGVLSISFDGRKIVTVSGFPRVSGEAALSRLDHTWENLLGEWREVRDVANTAVWKELELRAYDAGVAWKVPQDAGEYVFDFAQDARCWPVSHAQGKYEPFPLSRLGEQRPMPGWAPVAAGFGKMFNYDQDFVRAGSCESPLVVEPQGATVALGDAAVYGTARLRFEKGARGGTVKSYLEGPRAGDESSWKYVRVAATPAELYAGNDLLLNLASPADSAAVPSPLPGKVLRLAKLDTQIGHEAIDFIVTHGMQYLEIDCGWYGQEHTGDPLKPGLAPEKVARGEKFDLFDILAYAKTKNVPVILYVNRAPLIKNHEQILDTLKSWGVAGVKYGFLHVGSAKARDWAFTLIKAAAERGLLVDIHDEMRYTGEQRTYPNMMTVEGICGNEEMPTADHDAALVFTRFLTGPGDYTPCWRVNRVKNTLAHQLALPVAYFSPWQFLYWYSKPSDIPDDPALALWQELPTVWDETKVLSGEIGKYAVVARRKGTKWYVGGVNGLDRRSLTIDPAFLGAGEWKARLFTDADPALEQGLGAVAIREIPVTGAITVDCAARGGFAMVFTRRSTAAMPRAARVAAFLAQGDRALADRLCMYWKSHATDVFVRNEAVESVGGARADVPTVMFNGNRSHVTAYARPRIEDLPRRTEYDGGMMLVPKGGGTAQLVPYGKTGCMIGSLNQEILSLARDAAREYGATGDRAYARLAYEALDTYLLGILARNVATDLGHGHMQTLFGMQSMETIHDSTLEVCCDLYAALKPYLAEVAPGKLAVYQKAFCKWADVQIANGVADNNWDMMQLNAILSIALVLDEPQRAHYIDVVFNQSSVRNLSVRALAEKGFDPETGIWWECPGYSMVTLKDYAKFAARVRKDLDVDLLEVIPVLRKAFAAAGEYLYPDKMIMGFGDTHPAEIHDSIKAFGELKTSPFFYAPNASWLVARSGMDPTNDVAFALNGSLGNHQHANGISLELYAKGYRLAPDAGIGWSLYSGDDYKEYYSQFPAHNTVMVNSRSTYQVMKSYHPFTLVDHGADWATVSFREPCTGAEQQRTVRYVKDEEGAYFVDVFRSRIPGNVKGKGAEWHDYYYHNLGDKLTLNGDVRPTDKIAFVESGLYALSYIQDKWAREGRGDLIATFDWARPEGNVQMRVFMNDAEARTFIKALAPATEGLSRIKSPNYGITRDTRTPVLVVRQEGEAWERPFIAVMDPGGTVESVAFAENEIRVRRTSGKVDVVSCR
ncbi:MAG: glycoside hydrolase family 97 catalytic domain-containing protein [Kiritimatiellia bacterium]